MDTEVVIVGAGPAGSTAARELASRGVDVLLLERAKFPRDKPCGGAVTIRCDALLPFSLDPVIEDVITGAVIQLRDGKAVTRNADAPITYMTQRRHLDRFLAKQAQAAGAELQDGRRVEHIEQTPDGFDVRIANGPANGSRNGGDVIHARAVLGADGANGVVRTFLGYEHFEESGVALEANVPFPDGVPQWLRGRIVLRLAAMPGGYGWIFPKGDHVNIGVGGWKAAVGADLRPQLESLCRGYDIDPASLEGIRGHHLPMLRHGADLAARGSALLGDAAGLVDPLSGEGIYGAIASGVAIAPVAEDYVRGRVDTLAGYQRVLERELLPELAVSHGLMEVFHLWPAPFVRWLQHSDRVWTHCMRLERGEETYLDVLAASGPARHIVHPLGRLASAITSRRLGRPKA